MMQRTRYESSVDIIKPLVYRIVWPNGDEELVSGTNMLANGITYLNEECQIFEYEHVSAADRLRQERLEHLYQAACALALNTAIKDGTPELLALKKALDTCHE